MSETTSRVLQLLGLLQSRRVWTGEELAERLGVTTRSVRRDVERLRDLGYPVHASKGHGGGYQLGAGAALPPLLLDPDEAVAMAVCLRLAAGGSVAGVGESALRALSKLDQVMPARLRSQVAAVHDATVTLPSNYVGLTRRTRGADDAGAGLPRPRARHGGYVDRAGNATERRLEPYQLVTTGRRWYLLAYDRDRQDWRSLRLDRMADVRALGSTFVATRGARRGGLRAAVDQHLAVPLRRPGALSGTRTRCGTAFLPGIGDHRGGRPRRLHRHRRAPTTPSAWCSISRLPGCEFEVLEPPEVVRAVGSLAERLRRAAVLGGDPEAVGKEQERRGEFVVGRVATDQVPIHLLAHGAHAGSRAAKSQ